MPHWRLFYHLVWATRDRMPLLSGQVIVQALERSLTATCRDLHVVVHAVGVMPDPVHLVCSIPPSQLVSQVMKRLKGASSHQLNQTVFVAGDTVFAWQAEYGVYSFGERALPEVIAYVRDQQSRHAMANLWPGLEQTESHTPGEREPTLALATAGDGPPTPPAHRSENNPAVHSPGRTSSVQRRIHSSALPARELRCANPAPDRSPARIWHRAGGRE